MTDAILGKDKSTKESARKSIFETHNQRVVGSSPTGPKLNYFLYNELNKSTHRLGAFFLAKNPNCHQNVTSF